MKLALMANTDGSFEVREMDDFGNQQQISWAPDLGQCLSMAAVRLGYPVILTLHGRDTDIQPPPREMYPLMKR